LYDSKKITVFCILFILLSTSLSYADSRITGFTVDTSLEGLRDLNFEGHNFHLNGNIYEGDFIISVRENGNIRRIFSTRVEEGTFEQSFPLCELIELVNEEDLEENGDLATVIGYVYYLCDHSENSEIDLTGIIGPAVNLFTGGEIDIANLDINFELDESSHNDDWGNTLPEERIATVLFESERGSISGEIDEILFEIEENPDIRSVRVDIRLINIKYKLKPKITRHIYGLNNAHIADIKEDEVTYYHQDRIKSTRLATNEEGEVVGEFKSLPFGQEIINEKIRYSFATGKELDSSGLYYFGARYYDPNLGRFTSVDPVKNNHAYSYVNNNPMNFVDPDGREIKWSGDLQNRANKAGFDLDYLMLSNPYLRELKESNKIFNFRTPDNFNELQMLDDMNANALSDLNIGKTLFRSIVFDKEPSSITRVLSHEGIHQSHTLNNFNGFTDNLWNFLGNNPHPTLGREQAYENIFLHTEEVMTVMQNEIVMRDLFNNGEIGEVEFSEISNLQTRIKENSLVKLREIRLGYGINTPGYNGMWKVVDNYFDSY
jgi:RHS repeat-associated protein